MKGLMVSILRSLSQDCTLNGVTSVERGHKYAVLAGARCKCEVFESGVDMPALVLVERNLFGGNEPYLTAYPVDAEGKPMTHGMFGGHYVSASDSRFPSQYPIPVHDRFEA